MLHSSAVKIKMLQEVAGEFHLLASEQKDALHPCILLFLGPIIRISLPPDFLFSTLKKKTFLQHDKMAFFNWKLN